ncbi:MAG: rod shape-determining protein MreD [Sphingomonadales bacterium]
MLPLRRRTSFSPPPTALQRQLVPIGSTLIASMIPLAPVVLTEPLLPPLGLMVFLAWRLLRNDIWPLWMGIPLGLWDDFFSGQPLGTALAGWTAVMLAVDWVERRFPWRSHVEDWAIATVAIAAHLLFALIIAGATGGGTSPLNLLPQIVISALCWPLVTRFCGALDRWRNPR